MHTLYVGQVLSVPARTYRDEDDAVQTAAIDRVYNRGKDVVEVEYTADGVTITALALGVAQVDIIDTQTEPGATVYEIAVVKVRKPEPIKAPEEAQAE